MLDFLPNSIVVNKVNASGTDFYEKVLEASDINAISTTGINNLDSLIVNKLTFNTGSNSTVTDSGQLTWNINDGTVDIGLLNGSILQVGQESLILIKNQTGSSIPNGTAVRYAGTLGSSGRILAAPMVADGTYPGYYFLGVATNTIPNGEDGYCTVFGKVRGIDTNSWLEGSILWCDPTNTGGFTTTEPIAPNLKLPVAVVINSDPVHGTIFVRATTGERLQDLHDVHANGNKQDKDVLQWNNSNNRWEASSIIGILDNNYVSITGNQTISGIKSFVNSIEAPGITSTGSLTLSGGAGVNISGIESIKSHSNYSGSEVITITTGIQTNNNNITTLFTLPLDENSAYWVDTYVVGRRTDGGTLRIRMEHNRVAAYRSTGSAVIIGSVDNTLSRSLNAGGYNVSMATNNNDLLLQVEGDGGETVAWVGKISYQKISTSV